VLKDKKCIDCSVDFEANPETCNITKDIRFIYLKRSAQDKKKGIHVIRGLLTDKAIQRKRLALISRQEWLKKYFSLKVNVIEGSENSQ
jgi:hypothetical protein